MKLFVFVLIYFAIVALGVFLIFYINNLLPQIRNHTAKIQNLESEIYKNLRNIQFQAKTISNYAKKLNKHKNTLINEFTESVLVYFLPFKKLKKLLLVYFLAKKVL